MSSWASMQVPSSSSFNQEPRSSNLGLIQGVCEQSLPVLPKGAAPGGRGGSCTEIHETWVLFQSVSLTSTTVGQCPAWIQGAG